MLSTWRHLGTLQNHSRSSVNLSVRLFVCPSLNVLKIEPLVFYDILHFDTWPWYLVTREARFLKHYFGSANLGSMGLNQAQNGLFCYFLEFGSYFFLELHTMIVSKNGDVLPNFPFTTSETMGDYYL